MQRPADVRSSGMTWRVLSAWNLMVPGMVIRTTQVPKIVSRDFGRQGKRNHFSKTKVRL